MAETDSLLGPGIDERANNGVVVELDSESAIYPDTPGSVEPLLELPSTPISTNEVHPGIVKAELDEGNFYIQGIEDFAFYKSGVRVLVEVTEDTKKSYSFPLNIPDGALIM